jgi:hypothetical protein
MIDVWRDAEGVRMALEEIYEEDFTRSIIHREASGATPETLARMEARIAPRKLAWGYYRFAEYLMHLDELLRAGLAFAFGRMSAVEVEGLLTLQRARAAFEDRHPACSACGRRLQNRFEAGCSGCGAKFQRKKG